MTMMTSLEPRRLFAAGMPDTAFDGDGTRDVRINERFHAPAARDVAFGDDGRAAVVGAYYSTRAEVKVTRVRSDGMPDRTFGSRGIATMKLIQEDQRSNNFDVTVDPQGRVLVLLDRAVLRFTASGRPDYKFGNLGRQSVPVLTSATDIDVDARGRPVIVGTSPGKTGPRATVIRLGPRGVHDTSFGGSGGYKTPVPQDPTYARPGSASGVGVAVLSDGRVMGAAQTSYAYDRFTNSNINGLSVFRLNADGTLDAGYGDDGTAVVSRRATDVLEATVRFQAFLPDGGAIARNATAINDAPDPSRDDPRNTSDWASIDADGTVRDKLNFASVAPSPRPDPFALRFVGVGADGKLLLSTGTQLYRLTRAFQLDDTFTPFATTTTTAAISANRIMLYMPTFRGGAFVNENVTLTAILV